MDDIENKLCEISNFHYVHDHLFASAQPSEEQLLTIKEYGVSTIINLALTDSDPHLKLEDRICLELGLSYIHIPILWDAPSVEQCLLILDLIDHLIQEQIVWIHCAKSYRVSCLIYLYRQYYMNIDIATAHEELHKIWEPNETWTGLMHAVALQLQGRKATQDLQQSLIHPDHFS